jgi:penicillin-binding protein 2
MSKDHYSDRKYIIGGMMMVPCAVFSCQVFFLQVIDPSYKLSADSNVLRNVTQYPSRGLIYDRNGEFWFSMNRFMILWWYPGQLAPFDTAEFCNPRYNKEYVDSEIRKARYSRFRSSVFLKQISSITYAVLQENFINFRGFMSSPELCENTPGILQPIYLGT